MSFVYAVLGKLLKSYFLESRKILPKASHFDVETATSSLYEPVARHND